ncbi:hypothetical protein HH213_26005 [Duganella dendranthematis]|uniref:Uncharacterized protein n=1 Tax=Duganella dendranthematis TaxID=2728021 RepID=A0ABX6MFW6_9BURK|nr:hypothetical protein [Duganella dendranthematis]QJD93233.1 hypothetical protein HH213_26005 [Duganella dendranthematis]
MAIQCLNHLISHYAIDSDTVERGGGGADVSRTKVYYCTERSPWRNLLDVANTFANDSRHRPFACFTEAIGSSINAMPQAASLLTMIAAAVVALSAPQMLRVMLILHKLCKEIEETIDSGEPFDERQEQLLATQRYQIALDSGRAGADEFTFRVPIPPG